MFKRIFTIFFLIFFVGIANAGVEIPDECQTPNRRPGYCMWSSLETICRFLGYKNGEGLVEWYVKQPYHNGATPQEVEEQLKVFEIPFKSDYSYNFKFLTECCDLGRPVLIAFKPDSGLGDHAVIVTDVFEDYVYFVDTNHIKHLYRYSKADFKEYWAGWGVVLLPKV